jgi:MFS family permease
MQSVFCLNHKVTKGAVLGVTNSLQSISQIVAPLLGGFLINTFIPSSLGIAAAFTITCGLLIMVHEYKQDTHHRGTKYTKKKI